MRHALILPVPLLVQFGETAPTEVGKPRLHLCLAHLTRETFPLNEEYIGYYREQRDMGDYIIMDNGADESKTGKGDEIGSVLEAARTIRAQEIVLPDVQEDAKATCRATRDALEYLRTYEGRQEWRAAGCPRFMIVPQGRTIEEWIGCAENLLKKTREVLGYMDGPALVVGVAKQYHDMFKQKKGPNYFKGGRVRLIEWLLTKLREHEEVHLLGYPRGYHDLGEIEKTAPEFVRSVDSAKPVVYAMHNMYVDPFKRGRMATYPRRPKDYFQTGVNNLEILIFNLRTFTRV